MQRIGYYIFLVFYFLFIRITPFWFLYILSDIFFIGVYHVAKYRRTVVQSNLRLVFPDKDDEWLRSTEKKFYKHLCDISLESLKLRHMTEKDYAKRCRYVNIELIHQAYQRGQGVACMIGHYGNWEYSLGITTVVKHTSLGIYKPLKNKLFDTFFFKSRSHFGGIPVPMKEIFMEILKRRKKGEVILTGYASDQGPGNTEGKDWFNFLGQPTVVFDGVERITRKVNDSIFYLKMERVKRGYYTMKVIPMFGNAAETKKDDIVKAFFTMLEDHILEEPAYWLWSHRRWKRKMPEGTQVKSIR